VSTVDQDGPDSVVWLMMLAVPVMPWSIAVLKPLSSL